MSEIQSGSETFITTCPECGKKGRVPLTYAGRTAECSACLKTYTLALPVPTENISAQQYWLKSGRGVKGPYTKQQLREMLRRTRKTEHLRVAKSPKGPWEKILIERPVQRDAKPPRQEGRQIETPEIVDAFDSDYEDEYDYSDAVAASTKPASGYIPNHKRSRSHKKSRPQSSSATSGKLAPLWVKIVTYGLYLHGMILAAYLLGISVAMVRVLTVLCAEVFIPFQEGGVALREGDLAVAGMSLASTLVTIIVPVIWFYQRDEKWLSFVIALISSLLVSQFVTIAVTTHPLSGLLVWIPLVVPSGAVAVASVLYCLSSRDWPTIYRALGYSAFMLMATLFLHRAAPVFGFSLDIQSIPIYCRVSGPYLLIAVAVVGIEFGSPMLHWRSVAYRYMDRTTQKSIDSHCIECAALFVLSMVAILTMMSDTSGWMSALSVGVFSAALSAAVIMALGQIELCLTYVPD
jgi:hypothetical protein